MYRTVRVHTKFTTRLLLSKKSVYAVLSFLCNCSNVDVSWVFSLSCQSLRRNLYFYNIIESRWNAGASILWGCGTLRHWNFRGNRL